MEVKNNSRLFRALKLFFVFIYLFLSTTPTYAISDFYLDFFDKNNIFYWNPYGSLNCRPNNITLSLDAANLPASTIQKLEAAKVKEKADQNMDRYLYAEQQTGIPWAIIAALHYREGGMGSDQSILNGEKLYNHTNVDGQFVSADPKEDAKNGAEHFKNNAKSVYGIDLSSSSSAEDWGKAFLAYNRGSMYKCEGATYDQSPYVMNGYDESHMDMHWIHADSCGCGRCYNSLEGKKDGNVGALAIAAYLSGASGSSSSSSSSTTQTTDGSNVTIIGDSITVMSETEIKQKLPQADIHAQVSKQFYNGTSDNPAGITILKELADNKTLRDIVIYALGTNGLFTKQQAEEVIKTAGNNRTVIFVTNYALPGGIDYTSNNNTIHQLKRQNTNVMVADWASAIEGNPEKYIEDSSNFVHPGEEGKKLFAEILYNAITDSNNKTTASICNGGASPITGKCFAEGSGCTEDGYTYYWQGCGVSQNAWCNTQLISTCSQTIGGGGCGPTATAMVVTALTGQLVLPTDVLTKLKQKGGTFYVCNAGGTHDLPQIASEYGLKVTKISLSDMNNIDLVSQHLRDGEMIIVVVGHTENPRFTGGGHFIAIRAVTEDGKWKIFSSSPVPNTSVNDTPFNPSDVVRAINANANTSYGWRISN